MVSFLYAVAGICVVLMSTQPAASSLHHRNSYQPSNSTLNWQNCTGPLAIPGVLCAQLAVPIDYDEPYGPSINLSLTKIPTANASARIGSLIFNLGGPGESTSQVILALAAGYPFFGESIPNAFDIIGMDPRGIGLSNPISCDPAIWNERVSLFPKDEAAFEKLLAHNKALGESCLNMTGDLLKHIDSVSVAKDIESVRVALGDGKLNYLGLSYGTVIGGAYAELYPEHIRTLALDGNVDHSQSETSALFVETSTYESEFNRFATFCSQNQSCALYQKDISTMWDNLLKQADATPIPAPGCNGTTCRTNVTSEELLTNLQGALIFKAPIPILPGTGWLAAGAELAAAFAGDATNLSTSLAQSTQDPLFPYLAVGCLEWEHKSKNLSDLEYKNQLTLAVAPHTRGVTQTYYYEAGCIQWPAKIVNPPHYLRPSVKKAPPILLVNALYDPETSYVWAVGLLEQIPSGVLLTRNGDGHTSYILQGAAFEAINNYLLTGETPPPNTVVDS